MIYKPFTKEQLKKFFSEKNLNKIAQEEKERREWFQKYMIDRVDYILHLNGTSLKEIIKEEYERKNQTDNRKL